MSISEFDWHGSADVHRTAAQRPSSPDDTVFLDRPKRRLNRIREVRREQGVSSRRAAQLMGIPIEQLRHEEEESTDLRLSQVYEWQRLLEVPVSDLLVEPHAPLSAPVLRRAQLLRLMKSVQAVMERSTQPGVQRLAQTMVNQLIEIMPELKDVTPWHSLDRQTQNQNSRVLEQSYLSTPEPSTEHSAEETRKSF